MRRMGLLAALVLVGCKDNGTSGGMDLSVAAGNDMAMTLQTTIAVARMGNVTTPITVTAVVIAVNGDDPMDTKEWYIEDPAGGPFSGIAVYCNKTAKMNPCPSTIAVPALHDLVQLTGKISVYKGKAEIQPTAEMTVMANATPPPVMMVSPVDIAPASTNAGIRGALAKVTGSAFTVDNVTPQALYNTKCAGDAGVNGYCSGCMPPTYGGAQVNDGAGHEFFVENSFFLTSHLQSSPECVASAPANMQVTVGKVFSAIGGIVDVNPYAPAGSNVGISPTSDSDYTLQ